MQTLKKTVSARVTAIGFIIVIFCGNIWFVNTLMGLEPSMALVLGMQLGMFLVFAGGIGLFVEKYLRPIRYSDSDENEDQPQNCTDLVSERDLSGSVPTSKNSKSKSSNVNREDAISDD